MWRYFELVSSRSLTEINEFRKKAECGFNPRDVKFLLAEEMVERFHSNSQAKKAHEDFIARFQRGDTPEDMEEKEISILEDTIALANLLKDSGLVATTFRCTPSGEAACC